MIAMERDRRKRLYHLLGYLTALAVILAALIAIGESLRINALPSRYSIGTIAPALRRIGLAALIAALLSLTTALIGCRMNRMQRSEERPSKNQPKSTNKGCGKAETGKRVLRWMRALIAAAALCLIVYGLYNGSANDVLKKAVAICTECIGLG